MTAAETDDELLIRIHSGDEQAFVSLYRRRQGAIFRFALHMSGSEAVAEDITQEVFLAVIRDPFGYDPTRGTLSGYLFGIARKLVLRNLERRRMDVALDSDLEEAALPELAVDDDALADLTHREGLDALRRAVWALPRRYREVVVLCELHELDYAEALDWFGLRFAPSDSQKPEPTWKLEARPDATAAQKARLQAWLNSASTEPQTESLPKVSAPPESFFEKVRERDRDAARKFYKKYIDVKGMPVVAAAEADDQALLRTRDIVSHMLAG